MAVSVVAATAMQADAWATALVILGPVRGYALAQAHGLGALFVTAAGRDFDVRVTDALRGHLLG
jgi:thiamine biosynthesis lipoprotein